ncbi:MAG: hypothetical protein QM729_02895 [Solirubrobacterales bacterium]
MSRPVVWCLSGLLAAAASTCGLGFATSAAAQTYAVTNLSDSGGEGDGSLRGEVRAANKHEGPDTVVFAGGLEGTITFGAAGIVVSDPVDIEGPGSGQVTIRQTVAHRVFEIEPSGGTVKIAGLHLADGIAPSGGAHPNAGGDVLNAGASLTLEDDLITGGEAEQDGGIDSYEGPLALRSSTVSDNEAPTMPGCRSAARGSPGRSSTRRSKATPRPATSAASAARPMATG